MTPHGNKKTILLVDDEEAFLLSLSEGLVTLDETLDVILATDGAMALDMMYRNDVDLLVTDLKMPGMSGFVLLESVGRRYPEVVTMVMTSGGSPGIEERARGLGISEYFEKPINLEDFIASIRRALKGGMDRASNRGVHR